jgi:glucokinase-like ROK family protein
MQITGDQQLVKKINKSIVLETIRKKSPLSRTQISSLTGLHKGTVSTLINELIEESMAFEIGQGLSIGGRKPVMLLFNKDAGYAIGVNLGINFMMTILTNLEGEIIKEEMIELEDTSVEDVVQELLRSIQMMIDHTPASRYGIIGIGIGVPGIVNDKGKLLFAPNLAWENVDLHRTLTETFQVPVTVENEANAGALGEKEFGSGIGSSNLIFISLGFGIGTGILLNGELYKGLSGFSGEMGHVIVEANGKKCKCGSKGCWEMYASESALLDQAEQLPALSSGNDQELDIHGLVSLADKGSSQVIHLLNQTGEYIGIGISNIINTFNPELIIIGNRITVAEKWIKNPIFRVVEQCSLPYNRRGLKIVFSDLSIYATCLGVISIAVRNFFSDIKVVVEGRVT